MKLEKTKESFCLDSVSRIVIMKIKTWHRVQLLVTAGAASRDMCSERVRFANGSWSWVGVNTVYL